MTKLPHLSSGNKYLILKTRAVMENNMCMSSIVLHIVCIYENNICLQALGLKSFMILFILFKHIDFVITNV